MEELKAFLKLYTTVQKQSTSVAKVGVHMHNESINTKFQVSV